MVTGGVAGGRGGLGGAVWFVVPMGGIVAGGVGGTVGAVLCAGGVGGGMGLVTAELGVKKLLTGWTDWMLFRFARADLRDRVCNLLGDMM